MIWTTTVTVNTADVFSPTERLGLVDTSSSNCSGDGESARAVTLTTRYGWATSLQLIPRAVGMCFGKGGSIPRTGGGSRQRPWAFVELDPHSVGVREKGEPFLALPERGDTHAGPHLLQSGDRAFEVGHPKP